jgi:hypothetical protein
MRIAGASAGGNGTSRSSGVGGLPVIAAQPPSFNSASIAASVGCGMVSAPRRCAAPGDLAAL